MMNQHFFTNGTLKDDVHNRLERLRHYYEVPVSQFPRVPSILNDTKMATGHTDCPQDEFASQRTRDNTDEY